MPFSTPPGRRHWTERTVAFACTTLLTLTLVSPAAAQPVAPDLERDLENAILLPASPLATIVETPVEEAPAAVEAAPAVLDAPWVVNFEATAAFSGPGDDTTYFGDLRQFTYLQVLDYSGAWAHVYNPRNRATMFVSSAALGPYDEPPAYIRAAPPASVEMVEMPGRIVGSAPLAFYPTPAEEAYVLRLGHNDEVYIVDTVLGEDGNIWYRTGEGDYLPSESVRLPVAPPRTFEGRWIDVQLSDPTLVTLYEGDQVVKTMLAIRGSGKWQTPTGVFRIQRRVANETMSSDGLGIPRDAPDGYHLENVLFTQYFLGTGESFHYNYWSSNFGYPGSHGCLGLSYADSEFLWHWASVGTAVSIYY